MSLAHKTSAFGCVNLFQVIQVKNRYNGDTKRVFPAFVLRLRDLATVLFDPLCASKILQMSSEDLTTALELISSMPELDSRLVRI